MGMPILSAIVGLIVRAGPHRAPRSRGNRAVDRSDARDDDRPRRRDRLRALHGLALPREPKGRHGVRRGASRALSRPSGSAIVFAGGTVVIALVTLLIAGIPLVTSLGYASAFAVITAVLAALTLLPGGALASRRPHRVGARARRSCGRSRRSRATDSGPAWSRFVTGHPWMAMGAATILLVPLIIPLRVAPARAGGHRRHAQEDTQERQAYDLHGTGFGPGYNGPLLVAVSLAAEGEDEQHLLHQEEAGREASRPS